MQEKADVGAPEAEAGHKNAVEALGARLADVGEVEVALGSFEAGDWEDLLAPDGFERKHHGQRTAGGESMAKRRRHSGDAGVVGVTAEGAQDAIAVAEVDPGAAVGAGDDQVDLVLEEAGVGEGGLHCPPGFGRLACGERFGGRVEDLAEARDASDRRLAALAGVLFSF